MVLDRSVPRSVIQCVPQQAGGSWHDSATPAVTYPTLHDEFIANRVEYIALPNAELKRVMEVVRHHMTPAELRAVINPTLEGRLRAIDAVINIHLFVQEAAQAAAATAAIDGANLIFAAHGMRAVVRHTDVINATDPHFAPLFNPASRNFLEVEGLNRRQLIRDIDQRGAAGVQTLKVLWVRDYSGYGGLTHLNPLREKPEGATMMTSRTDHADYYGYVTVRHGRSGHTMAHEIGHALGNTGAGNLHGQHTSAIRGNLMHSGVPPGFKWLFDQNRILPEQMAAFKSSKYATWAAGPAAAGPAGAGAAGAGGAGP